MTNLQLVSLLMPVALLAFVLVVMVITGRLDRRDNHTRNKAH
jgi:hypothetical protein